MMVVGTNERRVWVQPAGGSELLGIGAAPAGRLIVPTRSGAGEHPWDEAHRVVRGPEVFEFADEPVYAEPDLVQVFPHEQLTDRAPESFSAPPCADKPPDGYWPIGTPAIGWHLDGDHSGLKAARDRVGDTAGRRIRIGHLDTGYDPGHESLPLHLRADLGRNFAGGDPNDATDPGRHFPWNQPGHGTATGALLAGRRVAAPASGFNDFLGGAPHADVVPIRIADSVVHFRTQLDGRGDRLRGGRRVRGRLDQHGRHSVPCVGNGGEPGVRGGGGDLRRGGQSIRAVAADVDRLPGAVRPRGGRLRRDRRWVAVLSERLSPPHAGMLRSGIEDVHRNGRIHAQYPLGDHGVQRPGRVRRWHVVGDAAGRRGRGALVPVRDDPGGGRAVAEGRGRPACAVLDRANGPAQLRAVFRRGVLRRGPRSMSRSPAVWRRRRPTRCRSRGCARSAYSKRCRPNRPGRSSCTRSRRCRSSSKLRTSRRL